MTNNVENAADIGADLAALRSDIARPAERFGELAQHGKQAARIYFTDAVGDARTRSATRRRMRKPKFAPSAAT